MFDINAVVQLFGGRMMSSKTAAYRGTWRPNSDEYIVRMHLRHWTKYYIILHQFTPGWYCFAFYLDTILQRRH